MRCFSLDHGVKSKISIVLQSVFIMCWLSVLSDTDSLHSVYSLCGIVSVFCLCDNYQQKRKCEGKLKILLVLVSFVFSLLVILANYPVFLQVRDPALISPATNMLQNLLNGICCLVGGIVVAWNLLTVMFIRLPLFVEVEDRSKSGLVFWLSFGIIALIDLIYLFLDEYPGHLTPDSMYQVQQGFEGVYINDNPFWHTFAIRGILSLGYGFFGTPNGAVAFFSVVQLLLLAACMAYALVTLYQAGAPKWCMAVCLAVYALSPYNIAMSITMWKDVPFSAAAMVLAVSLYRILAGVGKKQWHSYLLFALSGLVLCLSRTTGIPTMILSGLVFLPVLLRRNRKLLCILAVVLAVCLVLTGPVQTALNVQVTDFTEALNVPLQQLARVVADGCPLEEGEREMLSRIFDLEEIPSLYQGWLADPIKLEVRENDVAYLRENLGEYGRLWLRLGLKYPGEYLKAWVDQTKGYWNGGYDYHQYAEMVEENPYGIEKTGGNGLISKLFYLYFGLTRHGVFLEPLNSIGLHVWLLILCVLLNAVKKRPEGLLPVTALAIVFGLLFGTPVYSEFRYAYAVFLICPVVLPLTVFHRKALS